MGSGASTNRPNRPTQNVDQMEELNQFTVKKHQSMEMIERFVMLCYLNCPKIESLWLILSNKLGQKAFSNFVRAETVDKFLDAFISISDILSHKDLTYEELLEKYDKLKTMILAPGSDIVTSIPILLRNELMLSPEQLAEDDEPMTKYSILDLLLRLQNEFVILMARDLFQRFLGSKYYKNWRASESNHAIATTYEDASVQLSEMAAGGGSIRSSLRASFLRASFRFRMRNKSVVKPNDLSSSAFSFVESASLPDLLKHRENWLSALLSAVEALPISFTLSNAKGKGTTFPIIYANPYFEKMSGFSRKTCLTKNLDFFLHTDKSEPEKYQSMLDGLKKMLPTLTIITNQKKDKKTYRSLIALKPITDEQNNYFYVISIYFDVTEDLDLGINKLSLAKELLDAIPDNVFFVEEHNDEQQKNAWFF